MLQRAASNAYSWWWASHVRTKQSKWLQQNLQDMEEKVQDVLRLIQEDGDSFAKRAEMYYRKRPEIVQYVEESYRAYRAMAERYDHMSTELQNANRTIASAFPEKVQYAMDEEDDDNGSTNVRKKPFEIPKQNIPNVPSVPAKDLKRLLKSSHTESKARRPAKIAIHDVPVAARSGLSKTEAIKEINDLQKGILVLQTEKEFLKVSYENGIRKYWEIEARISEMQGDICRLQDEFGVGAAIEDEEARMLMASSALKSCQEALARLQDKHKRSDLEAREESRRTKDITLKLDLHEIEWEDSDDRSDSVKSGEMINTFDRESLEATMESIREKINEQLGTGSSKSLTVTEMAEKIDELVTKVVDLESTVSSQTALIRRLRTENVDIHALVSILENDKNAAADLKSKFKEMENLNQYIENQSNNLQMHFTDAHCNLDLLTEKLHSMRPAETVDIEDSMQIEKESVVEAESPNLTGEHESVVGFEKQEEGLNTWNVQDPDFKRDSEKVRCMRLAEVVVDIENSIQTEKESVDEDESPSLIGEHVSVVGFEEQEERSNTCNDRERNRDFKRKSEKVHGTRPAEVVDKKDFMQTEKESVVEDESPNLIEADESVVVGFEEQEERSNALNDREKNSDFKIESWEQSNLSVSVNDEVDTLDDSPNFKPQASELGEEDDPDWKWLFMNGLVDKEKVLLEEYTLVLQRFKEARKNLSEMERNNQARLSEIMTQLSELRSDNAMKDGEIQKLHQDLMLLKTSWNSSRECKESKDDQITELNASVEKPEKSARTEEEDGVDIKVIGMDHPGNVSGVEERFRLKIDEVLEQNLDFWLRFCSSFHQIQKYQTGIEDLQAETSKLLGKPEMQQEETSALMSGARLIYKHLREIQTDLTDWVEESGLLKEELQGRLSSLRNIQELISKSTKEGTEEEDRLTGYQAAKFQGEIMNMQHENNKVADELQAGLDHIRGLQFQVEKNVEKLNEEFNLSGSTNHSPSSVKHSRSRTRVPLGSFIFGARRQRISFFSAVQPALHRRYHDLKTGFPISSRAGSRRRDQ